MLYPDTWLETTKSKTCPITLLYYQRIFLRACMRYRYTYYTATRGSSKSFIAILSQIIACIFLPGSKRFLVSDIKKSSLDITKQKVAEIFEWYPLLANEVMTRRESSDYFMMVFKNGSSFQVLTMSAATRGQRMNGGVLEECAMIDGDILSSVILPTMNLKRRTKRGLIVDGEPQQTQVYITSAGSKNTFAYERLIELLIMECVDPTQAFVWGSSYELPVYYGLLDKNFLQEQKLSTTFDSEIFARESQSVWTGSVKDAWFDLNRLLRCRTLLHAEREGKVLKEGFYEIAADIARTGNNDSSIMVIKVVPNNDEWKKKVVYTENMTKTSLPDQAIRIKELVSLYHPREVVVDGNGIGAGLVDQLVIPQWDRKGRYWEPLYVSNDPETYPYPREEKDKAIVYNIKANAAMNNDIYSNLFIQINNGHVQLLANERIVKEKLLATKKGQKMNFLAKERFLLPYVMTSRLIDELNNLKLRPTGVQGQIAVEQITKRINKDRVSALGYGLYRIKFYEDEEFRRKKKSIFGGKTCAFFSSSSDKRRTRR